MGSDEELRFQRALAFHCAPALAGIKPADLISWPGGPETAAMVDKFSRTLAGAGIRFRLLGGRGERRLILVYRPLRLKGQLCRLEVRAQLRRDGYPVEEGLEAMLDCLEKRLAGAGDFPHEVGLFLGYPAADVEGFRKHGGRDCKLSGLWKVYGDAEWAGRYFVQCRRCRRVLSRMVGAGRSLSSIFPGAGEWAG